MKKFLIGLGILVVLLVVAALVVPLLIPTDTYKREIAQRVQAETGRALTINGDVSFQLIPSIAFTVEDVTLANAQGAEAPDMATLERLDVRVRLLPLLSGELEIATLVLVRPDINLEVAPGGRANWAFTPERAPDEPATDQPQDGGVPAGLRLGDVRIEEGRIRYSDRAAGTAYTLESVNVTVSMPDARSPLTVDGDAVFNGQRVALDMRLESLAGLESENGAGLRIQMESEPVTLDFDGRARQADTFTAAGPVALTVPSMRELGAWLGNPIDAPGENSFQRLALNGQLSLQGSRAAIEEATLRFDAIEGRGRLAVDTGGRVPSVEGRLDVETLDLTPYLGTAGPADGGQGAGNGGGTDGGQGAAAGWSNQPIDASALRQVNAELGFSAQEIRLRRFTIGRSRLAVTLRGGRLSANLEEANLYGGQGGGQAVLDASGEALALVVSGVSLNGFQAEPFLRDATGYDRLSGTANFQLPFVAGRGRSMRALMSSLTSRRESGQATGSFEFRDGSLKGYNLAAMVRYAGSLFTDPSAFDARDTDFTRLGGTFTIADGVLDNPDLEMISPLLRLAGAGTANMGAQTLDYRFEPRAVLTLEGQGGQESLGGMVVPVNCTGPWQNTSCRPDISGLRVVGRDGQLQMPTPDVMQRVPDSMRERLPENLRQRLFPGGRGDGAGEGTDTRRGPGGIRLPGRDGRGERPAQEQERQTEEPPPQNGDQQEAQPSEQPDQQEAQPSEQPDQQEAQPSEGGDQGAGDGQQQERQEPQERIRRFLRE